MGIREQNIIREARVTLNDVDKNRWTDERLFYLLNVAQQEMCREVPLITHKTTIITHPGQDEYTLPDDALQILTARVKGQVLEVVSMEELDRLSPSWEEDISSQYLAIVVNNLSQYKFRPYPKLPDDYSESVPVIIRYSKRPQELGYVEDEEGIGDTVQPLEISTMWDGGLIAYVIFKAFVDYGDASSLSRAQVSEAEFLKYLVKAKRMQKKGYSKRVITTGFNNRVASTMRFLYGGRHYGSGYSRFEY